MFSTIRDNLLDKITRFFLNRFSNEFFICKSSIINYLRKWKNQEEGKVILLRHNYEINSIPTLNGHLFHFSFHQGWASRKSAFILEARREYSKCSPSWITAFDAYYSLSFWRSSTRQFDAPACQSSKASILDNVISLSSFF